MSGLHLLSPYHVYTYENRVLHKNSPHYNIYFCNTFCIVDMHILCPRRYKLIINIKQHNSSGTFVV